MAFAGITSDKQRADVIAYLRTLSDNPAPLPTADEAPKPPAPGQPAAAPGAAGGTGSTEAVGASPSVPARAINQPELDRFLAAAEAAADVAGAVVRPLFRAGFAVDTKSDRSPVTIADRAAEQAMRAVLAERFPDHGVLGEEFGLDRPEARLRWVLDPIDGTRAFVSGRPIFGTLIALLDGETPVLGVIDQPVTGERWIGVAGRANDVPRSIRRAGLAAGPAPRWPRRNCLAPARKCWARISPAGTVWPVRCGATTGAAIAMRMDCWRWARST